MRVLFAIVLVTFGLAGTGAAENRKTRPAPLNKKVLPPGDGWWCLDGFPTPNVSQCVREEAYCATFADIRDVGTCYEQKKVWLFTFLLGDDEVEMFFAFPSSAQCKTARGKVVASGLATRASSCKVVGRVKGRKKPSPSANE